MNLKLPTRPKVLPASIDLVIEVPDKLHYTDIYVKMLRQPKLKDADIKRIVEQLATQAYSKGFRDGSLINEI